MSINVTKMSIKSNKVPFKFEVGGWLGVWGDWFGYWQNIGRKNGDNSDKNREKNDVYSILKVFSSILIMPKLSFGPINDLKCAFMVLDGLEHGF